MTDISVKTTTYAAADRSWLLSAWGQGPGENPNCTLRIPVFTAGTHYPDGYLRSGTPLGVITALSGTGVRVVGPYDNTAADGREVFAGFLHSPVTVPASGADPGGALVVCGFIRLSRLPLPLDAAGQADGRLFHFTA